VWTECIFRRPITNSRKQTFSSSPAASFLLLHIVLFTKHAARESSCMYRSFVAFSSLSLSLSLSGGGNSMLSPASVLALLTVRRLSISCTVSQVSGARLRTSRSGNLHFHGNNSQGVGSITQNRVGMNKSYFFIRRRRASNISSGFCSFLFLLLVALLAQLSMDP